MITVLVVDGNARLGHVLGQLLDDDHRFRLVGETDSVAGALAVAAHHRPDAVLVSPHVETSRGAALCAALRRTSPDSTLVLWTSAEEAAQSPPQHVDACIERGLTYEELARAVRSAHRRRTAPPVVDLTEPADRTART